MKRLTVFILAAAMSLSLAACGKAGAEPEDMWIDWTQQ